MKLDRSKEPRGKPAEWNHPTWHPKSVTVGGYKFSVNQWEVARRASWGQPAKLIAEEVGVSIKTVQYHLHIAYDVLGVSTAAELARWMVQEGY